MHELLKFRKVCAPWVPRKLKDREKMNRIGLSLQYFSRYADEGEDLLNGIVAGDEIWVHHYQPESKLASLQGKHPSSSSTKKFKVAPSAGKLMFTVFWDSQRVLLAHSQKRGENVNSTPRYKVLLKLRDAIRGKFPGKLARGILLYCDNVRHHTA
jgi:hypothetical protein